MKQKIALAMIVKGSAEEADSLRRCLNLTHESVDGIFITITQPSKEVEEVCNDFGAVVSHFAWVNDFAAARNFNFAQVTKDFTHILWLDADDGLRGSEKLRDIIKAEPDADSFILNYMYAFDEYKNPVVVHMKTQMVKNNDCVKWVGNVHEDLMPLRVVKPFFIKDVERIHLSTGNRIEVSKERNLAIAEEQVKKTSDDPRSWWNLGNALRAKDRYAEAIVALDTFLTQSLSDDEKYIARLRRAECYWAMGEKFKAIDEARYAIGTKPEYPDAYNMLGALYLETQQNENAAKTYLQGITKKPPYYSILVYNPRDYDYVPLKNLAKAYFNLSRPDLALPCLEGCLKIMPEDEESKRIVKLLKKETKVFEAAVKTAVRLGKIQDKKELKKELEALSEELKSHPAIVNIRNVNFTKTESSGKDLVFYCGNTGETWNPDTAQTKGIGGSEEAVIWITKLLAKQGWNIEVYANCGTEEKVYDGVKWKPYWTFNYRDKQDAVIIWRHPQILKWEINSPVIYVDMHDVISAGEFTPERLKKITKIFVKSEFHRSLFPEVPDEKFVIAPNGIDSELFSAILARIPQRDPMLMVNTSSPDRSLSALLDCYAEVKKQVPEAKLVWCYGWQGFDLKASNPRYSALKSELQARMKELGVEDLGRLSHDAVAQLYLKANILAYPSEFAEIDCISLSKGLAAGAIPLTTDFAAMGEKKGHGGVFIHSQKTKDDWAQPYQVDFSMSDAKMKEQWIERAVHFLKHPPTEDQRKSMREWAQFAYDWERVAFIWNQQLTEDIK